MRLDNTCPRFRKKSRIGCIKKGFHFLGIDYPPTQPVDNTNVTHANDDSITQIDAEHYSTSWGGQDRY